MTTMIAGLLAIGAAAGALVLFVFCATAAGHESRDAQLYRDLTARSAQPSTPAVEDLNWLDAQYDRAHALRVAAARQGYTTHACALCGSDAVVRAVLIVPVIDEQTGTRARERWCLDCAPLATGNWQRPGPVEVWGVS